MIPLIINIKIVLLVVGTPLFIYGFFTMIGLNPATWGEKPTNYKLSAYLGVTGLILMCGGLFLGVSV